MEGDIQEKDLKTPILASWIVLCFVFVIIIGAIYLVYSSFKEVKKDYDNFTMSKENVTLTPCICISECLQDYKDYGTVNYFSAISHPEVHAESRDCNSIEEEMKLNCCMER